MKEEYSMKSKYLRLGTVIAMLVLCLALLCFGVYSIVIGTSGIRNDVTFESGDDNVFVRINAEYSGPELSSGQSTYFYELTRENSQAYAGEKISIPGWVLGQTNFDTTHTVITLTFSIENLNTERELGVTFTNIAYDPEQKFTTAYAQSSDPQGLDSATLVYPQGSNLGTVNINQIVIEKSGTLYLKLVYTLQNFNEPFDFLNNIDVNLQSLDLNN